VFALGFRAFALLRAIFARLIAVVAVFGAAVFRPARMLRAFRWLLFCRFAFALFSRGYCCFCGFGLRGFGFFSGFASAAWLLLFLTAGLSFIDAEIIRGDGDFIGQVGPVAG
jgi:hypothetical protein